MWWRIYYDDGGTFDSTLGEPWEAPKVGVIVIAQQHKEVGYELIDGANFYYYEAERRGFYGGSEFTIFDHLMRAKRQCVFFGRMVTDKEYNAIVDRADKELPEKKSAWRRWERR